MDNRSALPYTLGRMRSLRGTLWAAALTGLVVAGPVALGTAGHVQVVRAANVTVAADEVTASALAEAQGVPVEALSDRTDYAQTFANPDGTFAYDAAAAAQRVHNADGSWSNVDPTLALQSDGTVRPAASPVGLVLSGGGGGPMLTVTRGSDSLSLTWPDGSLPAPTLNGATATYASVLTGVDLKLTATTDGVEETLVVRSASGASNPALTNVSFGVSASGLTVSADADGGASASDASGDVVLDLPEPRMWDSAGGGSTGDSSNAEAPGAGASIAQMPLAVNGGSLSLTPSVSLLGGASTVYPVFIDPEVTVHGPSNGWLDVSKNSAGDDFGDWEPSKAQSGVFCTADSAGTCVAGALYGIYRTYFNFPIPHQVWDSQTVSATLFTNEIYSWSCGEKSTVQLWLTSQARRGAKWSARPTEQKQQDGQTVAYGNTCPAHGVSFDASEAAGEAASKHWPQVTLELRADDEAEGEWTTQSGVSSWKKFEVSKNSQPFLQIVFDHAPDQPTGLTTLDGSRSAGCGSGTWSSDSSPSLQARITDPDGTNVQGIFDYTRSGGSKVTLPATSFLGSGSTFTVKTSGLADGAYTWDVHGNDGSLSGPSASCAFAIDTSPPATPTISSSNYIDGQATNPVGTVGHFTFSDPNNSDPTDGVNDVVGYRYGFTDPPLNSVAASSEGGPATVPISPVWLGSRTLYVQAVDRAGNLSSDNPPAEFDVVTLRPTGNQPLLAWWRLNEGGGTVAADATGNGHGATLGAQAGWGPGQAAGTSALSLTGASDSEAFTAPALPPVDNTGSFTVSAWVKLDPGCATTPASCVTYDAVSIDGTTQSGFALGYVPQASCQSGAGDGVHGCWAFTMAASDTTSPPVNRVEATPAVAFGTWVQLTAVYDQVHQTMAISVNGSPASAGGPATQVMPWAGSAMGPLRMGRSLSNGAAVNWWPGEMHDVCTFWGTLDDTQVGSVFHNGCGNAGPA
jgi:hypothetical protein